MADWVTISALATAGGTFALAGATYASVRSSHRVARLAEQSLLTNLRPLLVPSRLEDPPQKVHFQDGKRLPTPGGGAGAEADDSAVYLTISLRNIGTGIAVLHGWRFFPELMRTESPPSLDEFHRLTRDLYVAAGDIGFWQGTFRDPSDPAFAAARSAIDARAELTIDVLYGDQEGGQRVVSRYALFPREDGGWMPQASRHWNIDRPNPR